MKVIVPLLMICIFGFSVCERSPDSTTNSNNSSTPTIIDQKPSAEPTPDHSPPTTLTEVKEPSTKFTNQRVFAARLQKADKVQLFEGLPHQLFEAKLLEQELRTKKTVNFQGFPFYEEPLELKEMDATELTLLFCNRKSFKPHWYPKDCGGFHPDYCLEWHVGQDIYQGLVCFNCHEVMLFGPNVGLYCDLGDNAWGRLWELLEPYHKNGPGPRLH